MSHEVIFLWLLVKHFIIDFPLQKPYQYLNKGTYGHPGGILHAWLHQAGTFLVLTFCGVPFVTATLLAFADNVLHYHIDWAKVQINTRYQLTPTNSEYYWWLLGIDQLLHQVTYFLIVLAI